MHFDVQQLLHHYGYFGVFTVLFLEVVGIPFPAETTLVASGIEWTQHVFQLLPLLLSAAGGNIVGSTVAYVIGRYLGRPVILGLGKYVGITEVRLDKAEAQFNRFRIIIVLFGKFIAGIRVLIPYLAGINKMPFWIFTIYNAMSALLWAAFFIIIGKYIGILWNSYHRLFHQYLVPSLILLVVLIFLYYVLKRLRKHRKT